MNQPLISIITPSYNRVGMIQEAVKCVLTQDYPFMEHIIIDGGSTDGTLSILKQYSHLKILAEPDNGMYDALNKGLRIATGEIIGFLNTDDFYMQGTFTQTADLLKKNQADAVAGRADYFLEKKDLTAIIFRKSVLLSEQAFWREITYGEPAFNAWFFHRRVFDTIGKFDTNYRIAGDRDFLLRFALNNLKCTPLDKVVYRYRAHNDSLSMTKNLSGFSRVADENLRLAEKYLDILPAMAHPFMQAVRTRDTITAVSRNLRRGAIREALYYAHNGFRHDVLWPAKFVLRLITGLLNLAGIKIGIYAEGNRIL